MHTDLRGHVEGATYALYQHLPDGRVRWIRLSREVLPRMDVTHSEWRPTDGEGRPLAHDLGTQLNLPL